MHDSQVVLLLVGVWFGLTLGLVPIWLYLKQSERKHEREHLERMKALELGRPLPARPANRLQSMAFRIASLIGAGVPAVAFVCASLASLAIGYHESMWIATGMVGLGAVISGATLAGTMYSKTTTAPDDSADASGGAKVLMEDDAYDVVSARG
jgi:hypothetical protein